MHVKACSTPESQVYYTVPSQTLYRIAVMTIIRFPGNSILTCVVTSCPQIAKIIAIKGTSETANNVATQQKVAGVPAKKEAQNNTSEVTDERAMDIMQRCEQILPTMVCGA